MSKKDSYSEKIRNIENHLTSLESLFVEYRDGIDEQLSQSKIGQRVELMEISFHELNKLKIELEKKLENSNKKSEEIQNNMKIINNSFEKIEPFLPEIGKNKEEINNIQKKNLINEQNIEKQNNIINSLNKKIEDTIFNLNNQQKLEFKNFKDEILELIQLELKNNKIEYNNSISNFNEIINNLKKNINEIENNIEITKKDIYKNINDLLNQNEKKIINNFISPINQNQFEFENKISIIEQELNPKILIFEKDLKKIKNIIEQMNEDIEKNIKISFNNHLDDYKNNINNFNLFIKKNDDILNKNNKKFEEIQNNNKEFNLSSNNLLTNLTNLKNELINFQNDYKIEINNLNSLIDQNTQNILKEEKKLNNFIENSNENLNQIQFITKSSINSTLSKLEEINEQFINFKKFNQNDKIDSNIKFKEIKDFNSQFLHQIDELTNSFNNTISQVKDQFSKQRNSIKELDLSTKNEISEINGNILNIKTFLNNSLNQINQNIQISEQNLKKEIFNSSNQLIENDLLKNQLKELSLDINYKIKLSFKEIENKNIQIEEKFKSFEIQFLDQINEFNNKIKIIEDNINFNINNNFKNINLFKDNFQKNLKTIKLNIENQKNEINSLNKIKFYNEEFENIQKKFNELILFNKEFYYNIHSYLFSNNENVNNSNLIFEKIIENYKNLNIKSEIIIDKFENNIDVGVLISNLLLTNFNIILKIPKDTILIWKKCFKINMNQSVHIIGSDKSILQIIGYNFIGENIDPSHLIIDSLGIFKISNLRIEARCEGNYLIDQPELSSLFICKSINSIGSSIIEINQCIIYSDRSLINVTSNSHLYINLNNSKIGNINRDKLNHIYPIQTVNGPYSNGYVVLSINNVKLTGLGINWIENNPFILQLNQNSVLTEKLNN